MTKHTGVVTFKPLFFVYLFIYVMVSLVTSDLFWFTSVSEWPDKIGFVYTVTMVTVIVGVFSWIR